MSGHLKVLAIEDDRELAYLYESFLAGEGYEVQVARDANEAIAKLRDPPDVVLLDLMLPGMDGYTLLQRIRAQKSLRDVPVIVVSASLPPGRQRVPGANAVLHKPFDFDGLIDAIQGVAHHTHLARSN